MDSNIRILSTKKLQTNQKQFLLNAGFGLIEADFIQIEFQKFTLTETFQNLIFTSQNAVLSVLNQVESDFLKDQNCFCVGIKTKKLLENRGCKVIECFDYAEELVDCLLKNYASEKFTFFSGNLRKDTLPQAFIKNNIVFQEIQVYLTVLKSHKIQNQVQGILFFSPSAVQSYLKNHEISNEICFCIGKTTALELENITNNIIIANQPSIENVIIKCIKYYNKH
jgi:uroporphyrinogen-III synthase